MMDESMKFGKDREGDEASSRERCPTTGRWPDGYFIGESPTVL